MKSVIKLLVVTLFVGIPLQADVGESGISVLLRPMSGAKSIAMGDAAVAALDDVTSALVNPAGIAGMEKWEYAAGYLSWFEGMMFFTGSAGMKLPARKGAVALTVAGFSAGEMDNLDSAGNTLEGSLGASDIMLALSWAPSPVRKPVFLRSLFSGISLKAVRTGLADSSTFAIAADVGVMYRTRLFNFTQYRKAKNFILAATAKNLGPSVQYDALSTSLPIEYRAGFAWAPVISKNLVVSFNGDGSTSRELPVKFDAGFETVFMRNYYIRGGVSGLLTEEPRFSAGVGLKFSQVKKRVFLVDYAVLPRGALGLTHAFSLLVKIQ